MFLYIPTGILFLLVLTNDLHQLVFTFPADIPVWTSKDDAYDYGIGYYLIIFWLCACALTMLTVLYRKRRVAGNRTLILFPCIPIVALIVYLILHFSGAAWLRFVLGDMTAVMCLMYMATLEICIRCRFIQGNTHYMELFHASTAGVRITDEEYHVLLSSETAKDMDTHILAKTEHGPVMLENGTRLSSAPIQGGLEQDNKRLKEYAERMRRLSADIITLIREEEILNMKMRVHDDIGRSVISARRFLQQNRPMEELDLTVWKKAVRLLQHDTESLTEQDAVAELMSAAEGIGIKIILEGQMPKEATASGLFIAAMRECMTNAVRHAGATELYVRLACDEKAAHAVITNDGAAPDGEVVEGGGLTSLRFRVEQCGGTIQVKCTPGFELAVSVPLGGEENI